MPITRRTVLGVSGALLGTLPLIRLARGEPAYRLTILHVNDFHSRHDPVDPRALDCGLPPGPGCFGGSPRLATALAAMRRAAEGDGRSVLLLDAGDQFQGSVFYTALKGDAELAVMHAVGTEAMAVGNHEFDDGPANLARFIKAARFPVVSANIDASAEPSLAGLIKPSVRFERGGLAIEVVGLTTRSTATGSSPGPHVHFNPPGPALAAATSAARAAGARLVIALSHLGVGEDEALAGTIEGVALFVGGHSHTLLSNAEPGALGLHPVVIDGPAGRALVVQAACYGRYAGRTDLDLDADGKVIAYGGDVVHIGLETEEDPNVAAIVAGFAAPLDALRRRVVGHLPTRLENTSCRLTECPLGDLVADAMLAASHDGEVAIMNGGGLRTGLPAGDITMNDVMTMLPFGNTLATLSMRGADLRAVLNYGLSRMGRGGFPQVAGVRLTWSAMADPSSRLRDVRVRGADGSYAPLDDARTYRVVTNNFLRQGGDGYTVLRDRAIDPYDFGPGLDTVLAASLGGAAPPGDRMTFIPGRGD